MLVNLHNYNEYEILLSLQILYIIEINQLKNEYEI